MCYNGGTCVQKTDGAQSCFCPADYNGDACIYYVPGLPAGPGNNNISIPETFGKRTAFIAAWKILFL